VEQWVLRIGRRLVLFDDLSDEASWKMVTADYAGKPMEFHVSLK